MKTLTLAALGLLALTGCSTTLVELRESPPLRTAVVPARSAPELAACAMDGLETDGNTKNYSYRLLTRGGESSLVASTVMVGTTIFMEATFAPTSDGVRVETRPASGFGGPRIERTLWPIIERCAGAPVATR